MTQRTLPDWAGEQQGNVLWLDDDHAVSWTHPQGEAEPSGGLLWHRSEAAAESDFVSATPGWCVGGFTFRGSNPARLWTLESKDPMTLSPSFLCHCGHHGFIRNGAWVAA